MILKMTRSQIRLKVGEKIVTIQGEAMMPSPNKPDFVVGRNEPIAWDPPHEKESIDEATRQKIFDLAREELAKRKMTLEVE